MASTRIFVSSTFYDLKYVRADLEVFVRDLGYEPVLNERGSIPYGSTEPLEDSAYREVDLADILVSIIGGRFGTESSDQVRSISQRELERAIEGEKQVYIFIERAVQIEFSTYLLNKGNADVRYQSVDDVRVFEFLEEIEKLPRNNAISAFETAADITDYLRDQWSGLFQNLLRLQRSKVEGQNLALIDRTASTLERLLAATIQNANDANQTVRDVVLTNHPAFSEIQQLFDLPYRVFFTTRDEMNAWLRSALGFSHEVRKDLWDVPEYAEWYRRRSAKDEFDLFTAFEGIFDESGALKPADPGSWDPAWLAYREIRPIADVGTAPEKTADQPSD